MVLIKAWKERQQYSPHRPRQASTRWMIIVLLGVVLASILLGRIV